MNRFTKCRALLLALGAMTMAEASVAQVTVDIPHDNYEQSRRAWTDGPLTWDEFLGTPSGDTTVVQLSWMLRAQLGQQRKGITTYYYCKNTPFLDMTESCVRPQFQSASSLKLCQTAFDMLELYSRKSTRQLACDATADYQSVTRYFQKEYKRRLNNMVYDAKHGTDETKVDLYSAQVQLELAEEQFDASQVPMGEPNRYFGIDFGFNTFAAFSDYFGAEPYGFGFSFDYGHRRHLWMLDMALNFGGESKRDVETSNGWIHKGDGLQAGMMMLNWGYEVSNDVKRACWPYVGVGVTFFDGTKSEQVDKNGRELQPEKAGLTLAAGVVYDVPIRRHVYLGGTSQFFGGQGRSVNHYALRLKPSLSVCHLSDIGWVPCFNLGISFNMSTWSME